MKMEELFDPLSKICELHMPGPLPALDSHRAISTSNRLGASIATAL